MVGAKRTLSLIGVFCKMGKEQPAAAVTEALETASDELLAEHAKTNAAAFGILYQRHVRRIYSYIYYRTSSKEDAEDLTAKTFFQALSHMPRYQHRGVPFSAWLFRIAHNLVANWHRDNRRGMVSLDELWPGDRAGDDPCAIAENREELRGLRWAFARLPPERQHLLILKFVEALPTAQIAADMGRTEGAVKALLHRTLVSLRKSLKDGRESLG